MASTWHFAVFVLVSLVAFVGMLLLVLQQRSPRPPMTRVLWVAGLVVIGGMEFARMGITVGLPVWVYYGVPAGLTWVLPLVVFRMRGHEVVRYLPLALLVAPTIHVLFSFILGWKEYIPFMHVPSLWELIAS
jgi:hypothetical protein